MSPVAVRIALGRSYDRIRLLEQPGAPLPDTGKRPVVCTVSPTLHDAFRALTGESPYDGSEMSTAFYMALCSEGTPPFVALPVFPSRAFRYGNLVVRADSELHEIEELRGKRIGLPEYGLTLGVWLRGILADVHEIQPYEIHWMTAREPVLMEMPGGVAGTNAKVTHLPDGNLWDALSDGRIDAAMGAPPAGVGEGSPFRRLLPDYWRHDLAYFEATGNFPIMHSLVLRRSLVEDDPSVVATVFDAFCDAKRAAMDQLADSMATLGSCLPLLSRHVEQTREHFGVNWWPYGFERNRDCLGTLLRFSREQGLVRSDLTLESMFADGSLDLVDPYGAPSNQA